MDSLFLILALFLVAAAGFALTGPVSSYGRRIVGRFETTADETLEELFLTDVTPRTVTLLGVSSMGFFTVVFYLMFPNWLGGLIGLGIGSFLPLFIVRQMVRRRRARLETQLMDGLLTLANGMRAGLNLTQAMALVEQHGDKPLSQEFGLLLREIEHGTSVDRALDNAGKRLQSHNFRLLFAAMKTTRVRGGNMPDTLDRLSESLREIVRLEEKIKAQTAEGRTSAIFMAFMPAVVIGIYSLIDPEGVRLLFTDSVGHALLGFALLLNVGGFLWIRKIVSFEI